MKPQGKRRRKKQTTTTTNNKTTKKAKTEDEDEDDEDENDGGEGDDDGIRHLSRSGKFCVCDPVGVIKPSFHIDVDRARGSNGPDDMSNPLVQLNF